MAHPELDPPEENLRPLLEAIGRAVLAAAMLEKVLLVDIAQRRATRDGLGGELKEDLARLESQPAGRLLRHLRELGISSELAERIKEVVNRRNHLVHHFLEDPEVLATVLGGASIEPLVTKVDELAADCQTIINEVGPLAFAGAEAALGAKIPELVADLMRIDPAEVEDEELRNQIESMRPWGQLLLGDPGEERPSPADPPDNG